MTCPKCQSDEWKSASLIYKAGLTHVATNSSSSGVGVSGGGIGVGIGNSDTSGTHQTLLSKHAAPPSGFGASITFIVAAIFFGIIGIFSSWSLLIAASCIFVVFCTWPSDSKSHAKSMAEWENKRMCLRCGNFYYSNNN